MAALERALALAEGQHVPVQVAEHLDLDVPRRRQHLLDVEGRVAERRARLRRGGAEGVLELVGGLDQPHPLAAAAGGRLEQDREAELVGRAPGLDDRGGAVGARDDRDTGVAHRGPGCDLVRHRRHHLGRRPDEDQVVVGAGLGERRVLGQEPVARMDRVAAGRDGGGDDRRDAQVALGRSGRADADRLVGEPDVQRVAVGGRVDGDRLHPELPQSADDADGDLPAVRDQDAPEHRVRSRPAGRRPAPARTAAGRTRPDPRRRRGSAARSRRAPP